MAAPVLASTPPMPTTTTVFVAVVSAGTIIVVTIRTVPPVARLRGRQAESALVKYELQTSVPGVMAVLAMVQAVVAAHGSLN